MREYIDGGAVSTKSANEAPSPHRMFLRTVRSFVPLVELLLTPSFARVLAFDRAQPRVDLQVQLATRDPEV